jgi:hypothetical protein
LPPYVAIGNIIISSYVVCSLLTAKTDESLFLAICVAESLILGGTSYQPDVLGYLSQVQPLLITLRQAGQAQQLDVSARQLRKSTYLTVRDCVCVNHNLIRAEAETAYKARQYNGGRLR